MKRIVIIFSALCVGLLVSLGSFGQVLISNPCNVGSQPGSEWPLDGTCYNVSTASFTPLINPGSCNSGGVDDGWAWFTGDGNDITVTFDPDASYDPVLHVFEAYAPCTVFEVGCSDNCCDDANETVTISPSINGQIYFIRLQDWNSNATMTGCLSVSNPIPPVLGCTDPMATNYNSLATVDDGSCVYPPVDYLMSTTGINNEYVGSCLVTDCGPSIFTDDGGFGGDYSNSIGTSSMFGTAGIYRVFCPSAAGMCMEATFNSFDVSAAADYLTVGNGPTQNSPWFTTPPASATGLITGTPVVPFTYTSTDSSGCLTFRFYSNGFTTAPGWSATLQCVPCAGGPNGTDNNDCANMTPLCSGATINGNATGPGISAEGCTGSTCPAGGENHTSWYTFTAQTTGTIELTITPTTGTDDYDYAIYGPNVTCGALGSPLNCSDSGTTGPTGITNVSPNEFTEDVTGDGWTETITANMGDSYILVIDEWTPTGLGYDLSFGGTASLDCAVLLPVELSTFTAEYVPENDVVDLFWSTESENNNDFFNVERSIDGVDYKKISTVKGAGNTDHQTQYFTIDEDPFTGVNYYRLKQVDFNGEFEYSDVVAVNILDDFYDLLSVFPNPTTGKTEVIFNSYTNENVLLSVMSSEGTTIVNTMIEATKGGNRFNLDLSMKPRGVYIVTITSRDKVYRSKLVKE